MPGYNLLFDLDPSTSIDLAIDSNNFLNAYSTGGGTLLVSYHTEKSTHRAVGLNPLGIWVGSSGFGCDARIGIRNTVIVNPPK